MAQVPLVQSCSSFVFQAPVLSGASILNIEASLVTNVSASLPEGLYLSHYATEVTDLNFCNVSITYTHPGYNDTVHTEVWLPVGSSTNGENNSKSKTWNGRLQGVGGGGWATGLWNQPMYGAVADGYAVVSTDGGHDFTPNTPESWALVPNDATTDENQKNINWGLLQDFASITLNDAAVIGKSITTQYFSRAPDYSYFNGCSTGGRQGLMLAQRYPDAYDGILSAAPAINWGRFVPSIVWPQVVMNDLQEWPQPCELKAITEAAIRQCDGIDGVTDGLISAADKCDFDVFEMVGREVDCPATTTPAQAAAQAAAVEGEGEEDLPIPTADEADEQTAPATKKSKKTRKVTISKAAAIIAQAAWDGPFDESSSSSSGSYATSREEVAQNKKEGRKPIHPGLAQAASLHVVANITCTDPLPSYSSPSSSNDNEKEEDRPKCQGHPFQISESWLQYYLYPYNPFNPDKTPTTPPSKWSLKNLTPATFIKLLYKSEQVYGSILSTNDPDLSAFKYSAGGNEIQKRKLIMWHGESDQIIPPNGTTLYYRRVEKLDPELREYFRYFEVPGIGHCFGGNGLYPGGIFEALVDWVERGLAPERVETRTDRGEDGGDDNQGGVWERIVCPWPQRARYDGVGDVRNSKSWACTQ